MASSRPPSILWLRRNLRIADNPPLVHAARESDRVIPVYIVSNWKGHHAWTGSKRQRFLCGALASLAANLGHIGGRLIIRQGDAVAELAKLAAETGAASIHYAFDPDPFGKSAEGRLAAACSRLGIRNHGHHDTSLHRPDEVFTGNGRPYRVFTPYLKNWITLPKPPPLPPPEKITTPPRIPSLPLPTPATWNLQADRAELPEPTEAAAAKRLHHACANLLPNYAERRDFPGVAGTSRISQDLRFGILSIRTVFQAVTRTRACAPAAARRSIDCFIAELAWREFYFAILHHFPEVLDTEFNPKWRGLPWREPGPAFDAWKSGRTGFPIIDAAMRQLLATGFIHNRARMITAMFLTKDLHLDWKLGESHFMRHLLDGEIASNNGGWQWSAGTGADAAPYFRIQNPWTQGARYDPLGSYIKTWVPELADCPPALLHHPPKSNSPAAPGYPLPILDHAAERKITLETFKRHAPS